MSVPWSHTRLDWQGAGRREDTACLFCAPGDIRFANPLPTFRSRALTVPKSQGQAGIRDTSCRRCVGFWTCLLLVKQMGLASETRSRLINNQKCHNLRKISHSFSLNALNGIHVNHPHHSSKLSLLDHTRSWRRMADLILFSSKA